MDTTSQDRQAIATCLAWALRPIVRLMLRLHFPLQSFVEVLKAVYVEVAEREGASSGRAVSDNKISQLTGVHRADVAELRKTGAPSEFPAPTPLWRVCNAWSSVPPFTIDGFARPLSARTGATETPDTPRFESLVETVLGPGHDAMEMLDTLFEHKVVLREPNGTYALERRWPDRLPSLSDRMSGLAFRLHDAIAPRIDNTLAGEIVHPTWTVYSVAAPTFLVEDFKNLFAKEGRPMLGRWNDALTRAEAQISAGQPLVRLTCSLLVYSEPLSNR
ncbi:MAG: DUF6502 family protein [Casimicrobium sp.]